MELQIAVFAFFHMFQIKKCFSNFLIEVICWLKNLSSDQTKSDYFSFGFSGYSRSLMISPSFPKFRQIPDFAPKL